MLTDLTPYSNLNICVAASGGKDSMALLHFLLAHGKDYGITVSAINFDHGMRGKTSARDSAFVAGYCRDNGVPLLFYKWTCDGQKTETAAHFWRFMRYAEAVVPQTLADGTFWRGADAVATAHHLNDNAETVLFNLARGSGLAGLTGISDEEYSAASPKPFKIIRPLIACSRAEIDGYIAQNNIPYVDDETNFTDCYTRNKIRHNVLPRLEEAVPGAAGGIYRFSRIAAEDEEYFSGIIERRGLIRRTPFGYEIMTCAEKPVFKRCVLRCIKELNVHDYTFEHLQSLYNLQFAVRGKKFEFCGLSAFCEGDKISLCPTDILKINGDGCPFPEYFNRDSSPAFFGRSLYIGSAEREPNLDISCPKTLKFDLDKIPQTAVLRFMREGDRFKKFGGGTKNLGSYFTDIKIPQRLRAQIPLVADGSDILIVCGVEISDRVRVEPATKNVAVCISDDYVNMSK